MMKQEFEHTHRQVWDVMQDHGPVMEFAEDYKAFLNQCKTEREAAAEVMEMARRAGFENLDEIQRQLRTGDRLYALRKNKAAALFVIGQRPVVQGLHIICTHIDAPRLDIRPKPLVESSSLAYLKTHYYGGIKKYQWATIPLALHGVLVKRDGERIQVAIGESDTEPVFYISDLPKHLSAEQVQKTMGDGITGEHLQIIFGSIPLQDGEKDRVRQNVLHLLHQRYGVTEDDLVSAELEVVPAGKARDAGIDCSMISAYGQDDRVCAYTALRAILDAGTPTFTTCVLFVDKEEVGSQGSTGMNSRLMENLVSRLLCGIGESSYVVLQRTLENSKMLSADVALAYDPSYPEAYEPTNTARLGGGPVLLKYAGHMGKRNCNDANAEYVAYLRDMLDRKGIVWQTGEMGRIDLGGGGTIAPFGAAYGMQTADFGVSLLSMHAPYELASKADIYETYRAYLAFLENPCDMQAYE